MGSDFFADDCSRCADLCCVAYAFDKGEAFGLDKPAGAPCPNLRSCGGCIIHDRRLERGFAGCISYSCAGAGQRVTQQMFAGASWRDDPALIAPMSAALRQTRRLHDWLQLLQEARKLPLSPDQSATATRLIGLLTPGDGLTAKWLECTVTDATKQSIMAFLASLRPLIQRAPKQ
ncbi:hypothetical protein [Paracoccus homiensis]|uniref:hypothetical protein n=1 Tax=Paracoccus homiensis TaxID=364199 RepID=UPI00398CFA47